MGEHPCRSFSEAKSLIETQMNKIGFKNKEEQERDRQKKLDKVSLPSGERHPTMSQTDSSWKPDLPLRPMLTNQDNVNLPHPELVDCLDQFLHLIGLKHTKVTLKTSTTPNPCVLLSGPRCHVDEVKKALISALSCLASDTLVLNGPGARQYFQTEGKVRKDLIESSCQVLIREHPGVNSPDVRIRSPVPSFTPRPSDERSCLTPAENIAANKTNLQIKFSSLEDQQVNVLVVPMLHKQLTSTKVGKNLLTKAGKKMQSNFNVAAANCTVNPGDVLQVAGPASLGCNKLFFIECLPWDGVTGRSVQALRNGLKRCLDLCVQQELSSVAFPMIGHGTVLGYPLCAAIEALTESIYQFGSSGFIGSLSSIYVVIKPCFPDSECYHAVYRSLSSNMNLGGRVIFRSPTDDITLMVVPGVRLHVVFGDITHETTDAIVNSTNFEHFPEYGVCKDILTVAGPAVTAQVKAATVIIRSIFQTEGGSLPCKAILHVSGKADAGVIESLVCDLILHCEASGYRSIAIPAIGAGQGGMDAGVVAQAILRGVKTAASSTSLRCVTDIRLVLLDDIVFLLFKEEALQVFSTDVVDKVSLPHEEPNPQRSVTANPNILSTSFDTQQSVFLFLGLCGKKVSDAKMELKQLYEDQCLTHTFTAEEVGSLLEDDILRLKQLADKEGLQIQSDQGNMTVRGLKDGMNKVMQMIKEFQLSNVRRQVIVREEENLHSRVAWCILGSSGNWARLPKTANHRLEHNNLAEGIVDEQSDQWTVDLQRMEATGQVTGERRKIKRLENLPDFTLPLYWDKMAAGDDMKVVTLQESSAEYRSVEKPFRRTVPTGRIKIDRLQNVHLRRPYEAQRKRISDKNAHVGTAVEKVLYHGTTQDNCDAIMKTGFNRRFAGQNATVYGEGTYFAVNANYSAQHTYAKPAVDGSQLIFVARVLTGLYTEGKSDMKVPPPRDILLPHDRYDSVVDKMDNPSMHIVFHDNQACPDYLITILGTQLQEGGQAPDFTLPLYWDNMAAGEDMKVVTLQESSAEYRSVEAPFRRTVPTGRIKIERFQNVHLRRAYEAQRKHISDKNAYMGTAVEKVLYHGTTQDNCDAIMNTGFSRIFAGQNATAYGEGTYFAVNANYSAQHTYAKPAIDGSQRIFVARVLTGFYTEGRSDMKVPPPRDIRLPHDRYDSVVDKMDNPSIHVVFHDNQAYPDYLITILGMQLQEGGQATAHPPLSRSSTLRSTGSGASFKKRIISKMGSFFK